jgi:hypothetical protein
MGKEATSWTSAEKLALTLGDTFWRKGSCGMTLMSLAGGGGGGGGVRLCRGGTLWMRVLGWIWRSRCGVSRRQVSHPLLKKAEGRWEICATESWRNDVRIERASLLRGRNTSW